MTKEGSLRQTYLTRFKVGVGLLVLLAVPAVVHSHAAIESLLNQPSDWVPDSLPEKAEFNDFAKRFKVQEIVMISFPGANLGSESLEAATDALRPLSTQDISHITDDGANTEDSVAEKDRAEADAEAEDAMALAALPKHTQELIAQIREECSTLTPLQSVHNGTEILDKMTSSPVNLPRETAINRLRGSLVGPDRMQTCLFVSINPDGNHYRRKLFPLMRTLIAELGHVEADEISMVGGPIDASTVDNASIRSIHTFTPPSAIVAIILCFFCLRSIWLTGVITAIAVIGEGMVLAFVYYTGSPMNAILIVLPPLVFVLTVSSGIHLSNYYLDIRHEFPDLNSVGAAKRAMRAGMVPSLLATATTVIGLGSLIMVRLEPIRIFGFVASMGVMLTVFLLLLMLPGAMLLTKVAAKPSNTSAGSSKNSGAGKLSKWRKSARSLIRSRLARPWPIMACFLVITTIFAAGLFRLETTVNVPRMFHPESPIRTQYAWFEDNIGATVTGDLLLKFPPLTKKDDPIARLELVKRAHLRVYKMEQVDGVLSAMTFLPSVPRTRSFSSTAKRSVIRKTIRDPTSSLAKLDFISNDDDAQVWRISVRLPQQKSINTGSDIAAIRKEVGEELSDSETPVDISFTGHVAIGFTAQDHLLRDLFRSFLTAFGIVAIVMMIVLRSPIGGLLAMIPNLFPTIALFGFMGLLGTPLDIGSVMSASVALGIAVDGTIHMLSRFGSRREQGFGQIRATYGALGQCGWATMQTTLVCGLALMVYWFSDFIPTSRFALLMFGLLTAAMFGDTLLLPSMMASPLGRWLSKTFGVDPEAKLAADTPNSEPSKEGQK